MTSKQWKMTTALTACFVVLAVGQASALTSPVHRYGSSPAEDRLGPVALTSNALFLNIKASPPKGIFRLDTTTFLPKRIVATGRNYEVVTAVAARDNTLVYVKRRSVRAPRGYHDRLAHTLFVSDEMGQNRKVLHRENELIEDWPGKRSADCGGDIIQVQLLPDNTIQLFVVEYGIRSRGLRCRRTEYAKRQTLHVIRLTTSGRNISSQRFRMLGELRDQSEGLSASGNGRYVVNAERKRLRVVDLKTGRTRFRPLSRSSYEHKVMTGFDRSAVVVVDKSREANGSKFEYRRYSNIFGSNRSKHVYSEHDFAELPIRCGKRLLVIRGDKVHSISEILDDSTQKIFATLPSTEGYRGMACNDNRAAVFSRLGETDEILVRLEPFAPSEGP